MEYASYSGLLFYIHSEEVTNLKRFFGFGCSAQGNQEFIVPQAGVILRSAHGLSWAR